MPEHPAQTRLQTWVHKRHGMLLLSVRVWQLWQESNLSVLFRFINDMQHPDSCCRPNTFVWELFPMHGLFLQLLLIIAARLNNNHDRAGKKKKAIMLLFKFVIATYCKF